MLQIHWIQVRANGVLTCYTDLSEVKIQKKVKFISNNPFSSAAKDHIPA